MKKKFVLIFLIIFLIIIGNNIFKEVLSEEKNIVIIIDPGHGGSDPGTETTKGVYEKDINLEIAKRLERELINKGYKVLMTRDDDTTVPNINRAHMANENNAKILLSIHCNATENKEHINGLQVLYFPSESSKQLSQTLLDSLINSTNANNLGLVERRDLIVLNQSNMPAVLIETGFLSNENEAHRLQENSYQRKLVNGIVDGVEEYFYSLGR